MPSYTPQNGERILITNSVTSFHLIAHLLLTGKAFVTELVAILLTPLSQMNLDLPFPASDAINVNGTIHRVK